MLRLHGDVWLPCRRSIAAAALDGQVVAFGGARW
jgi:hypothetical protein